MGIVWFVYRYFNIGYSQLFYKRLYPRRPPTKYVISMSLYFMSHDSAVKIPITDIGWNIHTIHIQEMANINSINNIMTFLLLSRTFYTILQSNVIVDIHTHTPNRKKNDKRHWFVFIHAFWKEKHVCILINILLITNRSKINLIAVKQSKAKKKQ